MKTPAHRAKAAFGIAKHDARRVKPFAGLQIPGEIMVVQAQMHDGPVIAGAFRDQPPVAAPVQCPEPQRTGFFGRRQPGGYAVQREIRHPAMRGDDAAAVALDRAIGHRVTLQAEFIAPAAIQLGDGKGASVGQVEGAAEQAGDLEHPIPIIDHRNSPAEQAGLIQYRIG